MSEQGPRIEHAAGLWVCAACHALIPKGTQCLIVPTGSDCDAYHLACGPVDATRSALADATIAALGGLTGQTTAESAADDVEALTNALREAQDTMEGLRAQLAADDGGISGLMAAVASWRDIPGVRHVRAVVNAGTNSKGVDYCRFDVIADPHVGDVEISLNNYGTDLAETDRNVRKWAATLEYHAAAEYRAGKAAATLGAKSWNIDGNTVTFTLEGEE